MIHPFRVHYDKLLLVVALAAFGGSFGWVRREQAGVRPPHTHARSVPAAAVYAPAVRNAFVAGAATWPEPRAQAQRDGWVYEVFTPPVIRYDAAAGTFSLLAAERESRVEMAANAPVPVAGSFGTERIKLVGYFGSPDNYLVAFEDPQSANTLLVRVGQPISDQGFILKDFAVKKVLVTETEFGPVHEMVAGATLLDERSHEETVIDAKQPGGLPAAPLPRIEAGRVVADSH